MMMPGLQRLRTLAERHRRAAVMVAAGLTAMVLAGAWLAARQPASVHRHPLRTTLTRAERTDFLPASLRSCAWPMRVKGKPARGQVYLMRCYLRAVARRDAATLHDLATSVRHDGFSSRITSRELAHSADARAGVATVTFIQNQVDAAQTAVEVTFADRAREHLGMADMSLLLPSPAPAEGNAWRLAIGTG